MFLQPEAGVSDAHTAWQTYSGTYQLPEPMHEQERDAVDFPASHPQLQAALSSVNRQRTERERRRNERRASPLLSLSAHHEQGHATLDYDDSLELSITLPLGSMTHAAPRIAEAEAALTEAEVTHRQSSM